MPGHRVLLLSAAGIYALMSFTVAQRTREIGIRVALGARPRRVLGDIFSRATRQLALGMLVGSLASGALFAAVGFGPGRADSRPSPRVFRRPDDPRLRSSHRP